MHHCSGPKSSLIFLSQLSRSVRLLPHHPSGNPQLDTSVPILCAFSLLCSGRFGTGGPHSKLILEQNMGTHELLNQHVGLSFLRGPLSCCGFKGKAEGHPPFVCFLFWGGHQETTHPCRLTVLTNTRLPDVPHRKNRQATGGDTYPILRNVLMAFSIGVGSQRNVLLNMLNFSPVGFRTHSGGSE